MGLKGSGTVNVYQRRSVGWPPVMQIDDTKPIAVATLGPVTESLSVNIIKGYNLLDLWE